MPPAAEGHDAPRTPSIGEIFSRREATLAHLVGAFFPWLCQGKNAPTNQASGPPFREGPGGAVPLPAAGGIFFFPKSRL